LFFCFFLPFCDKVQEIRRQLTLFIPDGNETIEKIRATFNPIQYNLIPAHVTLCREHEINPVEKAIENIRFITRDKPIRIAFNPPERFDNGRGVFIPAKKENTDFHELRKTVLKGLVEFPLEYLPHITLMHPRNSTCTGTIFEQIKRYELPTELIFDTISLIEQHNGGRWVIIEQFPLVR
jgi:2'-5' RNA ligase